MVDIASVLPGILDHRERIAVDTLSKLCAMFSSGEAAHMWVDRLQWDLSWSPVLAPFISCDLN